MSDMTTAQVIAAGAAVLIATTAATAQQQGRDMSPSGSSSAQVKGEWVKSTTQTFTAGGDRYTGGKWIDITYGRPLLRGRDVFGSDDKYLLVAGATIWRAGANVTTQLTSEVPLTIGGRKIDAGRAYDVFIDVKKDEWTFVLSTLTAQKTYDPNNKTDVYGPYNYVPDKDVVRTKMKLEHLPYSFEQLSWQFLDMTKDGGRIGLMWQKTLATVEFKID
jgi:hypothetical protein